MTFVFKNILRSVGLELEVSNSYDKLLKEYEENGMSKPIRWRVCTGSIGLPHTPQFLTPSAKYEYEGAVVVECLCFEGPRLRRNYKICGKKCSICKALHKYILPFDYLLIATEM